MSLGLFSRSERKMTSLDLFRELYGGRVSKSGVAINWKTALDSTVVLACAMKRANGVAQVPLKLMREDGRKRLPATDHPLYPVLFRRTNQWQTSYEFRETIELHLSLCRNAYCFKNIVFGEIRELIPFEPQHVTVLRDPYNTLRYRVQLPGSTLDGGGTSGALDYASGRVQEFPAEAIWHIRGPSWNGFVGLDAVYHAREAIGLALATEETHSSLHRNGVQSTGVYSVDGKLEPDQYKQLRDWIGKYQAGKENAGAPLILDRAAKWVSQVMSGVDAQHLETRRFQIEEICRAMGVLPIMIGFSDKASTYASAEQMFLAHLVHTLAPEYERLEQSIAANLLSEKDIKSGLYANFVEEGLLRGSLKDTKDMILGYVNGGIITPNEGREILDLNPDDDPESDKLRIPANIVGEVPTTDANPGAPPQTGA